MPLPKLPIRCMPACMPVVALALILGPVGCAPGPASLDGGSIPTVAVKGKVVKADGKPVTKGILTLEPVEGSSTNATSAIEADGSFELMTRRPKDGAAPGKYRVKIEGADAKVKSGKEPNVEIKAAEENLEIKLP
jgi:hypothetical protein